MRVFDADGDGRPELWVAHGWGGRDLSAYVVPPQMDDGLPTELEQIFRHALSCDLDAFLFGEYDGTHPGLEIAVVLGAWTHQRLAIGHVDLPGQRLQITSVTEDQVCGDAVSLHPCHWEEGAFLALHRASSWAIEKFGLQESNLLPSGLYMVRCANGEMGEPSALVASGPSAPQPGSGEARAEVLGYVLQADIGGPGEVLAWLEGPPSARSLRVTPASMARGRLAEPLLVHDYVTHRLFAGDLDGDGRDEIFSSVGWVSSAPSWTRVLGLESSQRFEVTPVARSASTPTGVRGEDWPMRLFKLGCYREAIEAFQIALRTAEPHEAARIHGRLAACYTDMGQLAEAADAYGRAAEAGSESERVRALLDQGATLMELGAWSEALGILGTIEGRFFLSKSQRKELEQLLAATRENAETGRVHDLLAGTVPLLVDNPLSFEIDADELRLTCDTTRSARMAVPLHLRDDKIELSFEVVPERADWQTFLTLSIEEKPFTHPGSPAKLMEQLASSPFWLRFSSDGHTGSPTRWISAGTREFSRNSVPSQLEPGADFRFDLGEALHVTIAFLPINQRLEVTVKSSTGEVVRRIWFELNDRLSQERDPWLQIAVGGLHGTAPGPRADYRLRSLRLRAPRSIPGAFEARTTAELTARANGLLCRGNAASALDSYERAVAARPTNEAEARPAALELFRGFCLERIEPGSGRAAIGRALQQSPETARGEIRMGLVQLRDTERQLLAELLGPELAALEPDGGAADEPAPCDATARLYEVDGTEWEAVRDELADLASALDRCKEPPHDHTEDRRFLLEAGLEQMDRHAAAPGRVGLLVSFSRIALDAGDDPLSLEYGARLREVEWDRRRLPPATAVDVDVLLARLRRVEARSQ